MKLFIHKLNITQIRTCARNILKNIGGFLWSSIVKDLKQPGLSKFFDFKPEI